MTVAPRYTFGVELHDLLGRVVKDIGGVSRLVMLVLEKEGIRIDQDPFTPTVAKLRELIETMAVVASRARGLAARNFVIDGQKQDSDVLGTFGFVEGELQLSLNDLVHGFMQTQISLDAVVSVDPSHRFKAESYDILMEVVSQVSEAGQRLIAEAKRLKFFKEPNDA